MFRWTGKAGFEKIYSDYQNLVRNVLYGIVGEDALDDLTQETFIRIWKGIPKFQFKSSLETWIYRITVNTATDHLRKEKFLAGVSSKVKDKEKKESANSSISYTAMIENALDQLDEEARITVVLFYFEELPIKKIAKILGLPEGTVKSRLHSSKKKLKEIFSAKEKL